MTHIRTSTLSKKEPKIPTWVAEGFKYRVLYQTRRLHCGWHYHKVSKEKMEEWLKEYEEAHKDYVYSLRVWMETGFPMTAKAEDISSDIFVGKSFKETTEYLLSISRNPSSREQTN